MKVAREKDISVGGRWSEEKKVAEKRKLHSCAISVETLVVYFFGAHRKKNNKPSNETKTNNNSFHVNI